MKEIKKVLIFAGLMILCISTISACNSKTEKKNHILQPKDSNINSVSPEQAKKMMDSSSDFIILDVRTKDEYNDFHIKDAINIPDMEIRLRAEDIIPNKDKLIFVYCRSGRRSKIASKDLVDMGYTNIVEFGGIVNWPYELE